MQNRELREAQELLEESRSRYADLYDFAPVGYCTLDRDGRIDEINLAGAALLGAPRQALIDRPFLSVAPIQDRLSFQAHLKECATTRNRVTVELTLAHPQRGAVVVQLVSDPIRPPGGVIITGFRTAMIDTSALKRLETKLRLLAAAGETLSSSLDSATTLAAVARLVVPLVADLCIIDVRGDDGKVERLEVVFADATKQAELGEQVKGFTPQSGWQTPQSKVIATGEPMLLAEISDVLRERIAHDSAQADAMRESGITSMMVVPLRARGRTLGALTFAATDSDLRYSHDDLLFAEDLARRAAMAIDNARLHDLAQRATHAREALLAVVAHDLRTPLGVILLKTDLALKVPRAQDRRMQARKSAETVHRAAQRMNRLIGDLLDIASIEAGRLAIEKTRQSVGPLVTEAIDMLQTLADDKSLRLELAPSPGDGDECDLICDRERILQVFANLIGNAIKFSPEKTAIVVRAERRSDEVWFSVADAGPGLAQDLVPRIFDRFWQAEKTARLGTGLGLSIAKGIVEAHDGRIWVESQERAGSTFFFSLKLAPPLVGLGSLSAEQTDVVDAGDHVMPRLRAALPRKRMVLVVDDDPDARDALGDTLQHEGYEVVTAANGADALEYLHRAPAPSLIFLDLNMPVMDGWSFLKARNRDADMRSIPVIVVSCHRDVTVKAAAANAECLEKPITLDALRAALRSKHASRPSN